MVNQALALGHTLLPGQVLMTGSVGTVQPLKAGDYVSDRRRSGAFDLSRRLMFSRSTGVLGCLTKA